MSCLSCESINGGKRISPGPIIYEGKYWVVDHAYPTKHVGWLVMVLKKHKEALHELTHEEFVELGELLEKIIRVFHDNLQTKKEYMACFAEAKEFKHIHFHFVAKTKDFSDEYAGSKVFGLLSVKKVNNEIKSQVIDLSSRLKEILNNN